MAEETKSTSTTKATEEKAAETKPATTTATKSSTTKTDEKKTNEKKTNEKTEAKAEDAREAAQKKLSKERSRVLQNPSVLSGQIGVIDTTGTGGLTDSEALVEAGAVFKDPVYEATLEAAEVVTETD